MAVTGAKLTILDMHLDSRAIGNFAQPNVEVLSFPGLEEKNIVAVVEFSELVQLAQVGL